MGTFGVLWDILLLGRFGKPVFQLLVWNGVFGFGFFSGNKKETSKHPTANSLSSLLVSGANLSTSRLFLDPLPHSRFTFFVLPQFFFGPRLIVTSYRIALDPSSSNYPCSRPIMHSSITHHARTPRILLDARTPHDLDDPTHTHTLNGCGPRPPCFENPPVFPSLKEITH